MPGEEGREPASSDRIGMEGKCHLSPGKSGEALRKRLGVKKAPEMLFNFRGRKRMEGDHDTLSDPRVTRLFLRAMLRLQLNGASASPTWTEQYLVHFGHLGIRTQGKS